MPAGGDSMSTSPEADFDLEKLFLPAWAQEKSSSPNRYAKYTGDEGAGRKFDDRAGGGRRPPRRDGPRPGGNDQNRPARNDRAGGPRREGARPQRSFGGAPGGGRRDFRGDDRGGDRRQRDEHREPQLPLPDLIVTLMPDEKGVDSLS